jgi:hypothetical protein
MSELIKINYSGWYEIHARSGYVEKLYNKNNSNGWVDIVLPVKCNHPGRVYAKCKVHYNVALPKEFYVLEDD